MFEIYLVSVFLTFVFYSANWKNIHFAIRANAVLAHKEMGTAGPVSRLAVWIGVPLMVLMPVVNTLAAVSMLIECYHMVLAKKNGVNLAETERVFHEARMSYVDANFQLSDVLYKLDIAMRFPALGNEHKIAHYVSQAEAFNATVVKAYAQLQVCNVACNGKFNVILNQLCPTTVELTQALNAIKAQLATAPV